MAKKIVQMLEPPESIGCDPGLEASFVVSRLKGLVAVSKLESVFVGGESAALTYVDVTKKMTNPSRNRIRDNLLFLIFTGSNLQCAWGYCVCRDDCFRAGIAFRQFFRCQGSLLLYSLDWPAPHTNSCHRSLQNQPLRSVLFLAEL